MINNLFAQINSYRAQYGVPALKSDTLGTKDAEIRATQFIDYMATHQPGSPGFNPHQGYDTTAASLGYSIVSENLAYMTGDPAYIVYAAWQDSLHIAAMLATDADIAGVSCVNSASGIPYWTYEPGCSAAFCGNNPPVVPPTLDSEQWAFLNLINNYRAQNGAGPLQVSVALQRAAQWMSGDMGANNNASHTDSLGRDTGTRLSAFQYPYSPWGENIAGGYSDALSVFNGFVSACDPDSSGNCTYAHRKNMLNASFNVIGIGRVYDGSSSYGWYWTTDFGGFVDQIITSSPGPTISAFAANPAAISPGQATVLSWSVSGATSITIDNGVGVVTSLSSKSVSPAQTTTYTLTANNAAGSSTARATVTVSGPPDTQPPTTPVLSSAVAKSASEVDLAWTASSDNVGVAGYQILRNGSALTSVSGAVLSYSDLSVAANTTYSYSIKAFDAAGNYSTASNTMFVTTPAPPVSGTCPAPATNAFTGCYYNNIDMSGNPAFVRTDNQLNFNWLYTSPDKSINPNAFSARWQGYFNFVQGTYTFNAVTSDGMRVYVDGNIIIDRWRDQPAYQYVASPTLSQGSHLITVEFYSQTGWPVAMLSWTAPAGVAPAISSFAATPGTISPGQSTVLSWSVSGATSITIDNGVGVVTSLSSKSVSPTQTTTYTLTATNATGSSTAKATVTVSGPPDTQPPTTPVLSSAVAKNASEVDLAWTASTDNVGVVGYQILRNGTALTSVAGAVLSYADLSVAANTTYSYSIKAYDAAGNYSTASNTMFVTTPAPPVSGTCPAPATNAFTGCYYNNIDMSGNPAFVRTDNQLNFNWLYTTPDKSVNPNAFSARWQGYFNFSQGTYTFNAVTSDGMRVYIDGNTIIDRWRDQPAYQYVASPTLSQGNHLITVEFYSQTGWPVAMLSWTAPAGVAPAISSFAATPASITSGQSSALSWNVSGATSITIDNGIGDVTSLSSKSVSPAQTTTYTLTATNATGSSTAKATVTVSGPPDTQPPTTPVLSSAVAKNASEVDLAWTASTDNVGVAGYQILRNGSALTFVSGAVLSYADLSVAGNTTYSYSIKAYDAAGNYSTASNTIFVTTPAPPVSGTCPAPATNAFTGCYYNNIDMSGNPVFVRTDNQLNFNWLYTTPDKSVNPNAFSARWQGYFNFAQGTYTFNAVVSDGMRVYVDGNLIIDRWRDQPVYQYVAKSTLSQGNHLVTVEFYSQTGWPYAALSWQQN